jgi:hypothetical protein
VVVGSRACLSFVAIAIGIGIAIAIAIGIVVGIDPP